jgi:hypothetical protein
VNLKALLKITALMTLTVGILAIINTNTEATNTARQLSQINIDKFEFSEFLEKFSKSYGTLEE